MATDQLIHDLYAEIVKIPLIDPHSHIDPHRPTARTLDDILGYHYYTELAHSAGMDKALLADAPPRERVRSLLAHMDRFDNTVQYGWFLEIARTFLGFTGERLSAADADALWDAAERVFARPDWESEVMRRSNLEKVFLTNDFDDPLTKFDTSRYVPCLRTDDLVFRLDDPQVRQRLARATGEEGRDQVSLQRAVRRLFEHFTAHGAKACAISLPPDFVPSASGPGVFWMLAEHCREFNLPFDLMIGVNRCVYRNGVTQGQDLFDQRTSLIQYAELFNAFPEVTFCVSVLTSAQNQELASYSWIFPNVVTSGHWWYSNIPAYIEQDARARLQAVPKTKQLGYYSDMYKLEFGLPKYNMYRRVLAKVLADDFVRAGAMTEGGAVELARLLLRDNARRIFRV
ncbi:MAG TPA: amidohydrolase [Planctomycetales bacterium]|jgi:glucuronate isomerase|nr:amidohydrolase [Planctomycetales bacterium]